MGAQLMVRLFVCFVVVLIPSLYSYEVSND